LVAATRRFLADLSGPAPPGREPTRPPPASPSRYGPLRRVLLTDEVSRTLFEEYRDHRCGDRGDEEIGWVLLGLREADEAVVLATLPAGVGRDAGQSHVRFNSSAQALGSRIVRQADRRLTMLGVLHTHPGSLRHPSDGDYRGDIRWVGQLRGGEGVFGIGTADAKPVEGPPVAHQPKPNVQCLDELRLSWYCLGADDRNYRPAPVDLTLGPDLARGLRPVWQIIEESADRLDRLARQQQRVSFDVVPGRHGSALAVTVPLAEPGESVRVLMEGKEVRYCLVSDGNVLVADLPEARVDQGVYLMLAELAARD
jgi:hypothetical protein